ncbi:cytochrome P450 4c21-like [Adelges cooleyi]|uniref:cytochrome P450 4c21-like n=1 Tax=Adelges cooleyi TaxID=133065 RepID=UPI0021804082|nr:cytochrome P450 4c21-like [Adelges cooleyi]
MLAHHQDVQQIEYQEINSIFSDGNLNRPPTYEDLQKKEYLKRVIKETMRLYPAVPLVLRQVENEMMIGKYLIPADTIIAFPIYCLHLNPQSYKDPEKFNPDNFLPDWWHKKLYWNEIRNASNEDCDIYSCKVLPFFAIKKMLYSEGS